MVSADLLAGACGGGAHDGFLDLQVVQPVGEGCVVRDLVAARDLVEERARLVDEAVVVAGADPGGVHGQAARDVRVVHADDHPPEAVAGTGQPAGGDLELAAAAHVERQRAALAEHLELQRVRVAERDARDGEVAGSAAREARGEAGPVVVLDGLALVTHLDVRVPDNGAQRHRPGRDGGGQRRPGDRLDRAEQELGDIGEVAAQVGERAGAGLAPVAPAHRRLRVTAVVGPVLRADVQRAAEVAGLQLVADGADAGRAAEGEPDPRDDARRLDRVDHRGGICRGRGERLLAQDVLTGGGQLGDDLAVQVVRDDDAHSVDVVGFDDGLPAGIGALEAVAARGVAGQVLVDVRDRHEAHRRQTR